MNKIFLSNIPKFTIINTLNHSLKYYKDITYNHIIKNEKYIMQKTKIDKKDLKYLLKNDDIFTDLTTALMLADMSWDHTKSSKYYWRNMCISFTLGNLLTTKQNISLNEFTHNLEEEASNNEQIQIYDFNTPDLEYDKIEKFKIIQKALKTIKYKHRKIVQDYYYNGLTQSAIGKKYKLHQSRINHILKASARQLKQELINLI